MLIGHREDRIRSLCQACVDSWDLKDLFRDRARLKAGWRNKIMHDYAAILPLERQKYLINMSSVPFSHIDVVAYRSSVGADG
jgi:hypothetical protein